MDDVPSDPMSGDASVTPDYGAGAYGTTSSGGVTTAVPATSTSSSYGTANLMSSVPLIGPIVSGIMNLFNTKANNAAQAQLSQASAAAANQYNIQNWQMQAAYNTPAMQVQRLRDAGLNVALMYGSPSSTTGNVAELPAYQSTVYQHQAPQVPDFTSAIESAYMNSLANKMNEAQTSNLRANTTKAQIDALYTGVQKAAAEQALPYSGAQAAADVAKTSADADQALNSSSLAAAQTTNAEHSTANIDADTLVKKMQAINIDTNTQNAKSMISHNIANIDADTQLKQIEAATRMDQQKLNDMLASTTMQEAAQRIITQMSINSRSDLETQQLKLANAALQQDVTLKNFDIAVKNAGISPQSAGWYYGLMQVLKDLGLSDIAKTAGGAAIIKGAFNSPSSGYKSGTSGNGIDFNQVPVTRPSSGLSPNYSF